MEDIMKALLDVVRAQHSATEEVKRNRLTLMIL